MSTLVDVSVLCVLLFLQLCATPSRLESIDTDTSKTDWMTPPIRWQKGVSEYQTYPMSQITLESTSFVGFNLLVCALLYKFWGCTVRETFYASSLPKFIYRGNPKLPTILFKPTTNKSLFTWKMVLSLLSHLSKSMTFWTLFVSASS